MRIIALALLLGACGAEDGDGAEDDCWYCTSGGASAGSGTDATDGKTGTKGDGTKTDGTKTAADGAAWFGVLDPATGLGAYGWSAVEGGEYTCYVEYAVDLAQPVDDCDACELAFEVELGVLVKDLDAGGCNDENTLMGATMGFGHGAPSHLYIDGEQGWAVAGKSTVTGDKWAFSLDAE